MIVKLCMCDSNINVFINEHGYLGDFVASESHTWKQLKIMTRCEWDG